MYGGANRRLNKEMGLKIMVAVAAAERGRNYQKCKKPAASEEKEEEACLETILIHRKLLEQYHRSRTAKSKKGAAISVTRLGDFLDFWPLFKAFGSN